MIQDKGSYSYVFSLTLVATLGGLLFGYDTAVVSGAVKAIHEFFVIPLGLSENSANSVTGLVVSSALIGCIAGGLVAGFISMSVGRKKGLMLAAILFILSGLESSISGENGNFWNAAACFLRFLQDDWRDRHRSCINAFTNVYS